MADFTGMTVEVTLKPPHNTVLNGKVKEVNPGKTLILQNVFFPAFGTRQNFYTVQGWDIADIQVVDMNALAAQQQQRAPRPPQQRSVYLQGANPAVAQRPAVAAPPLPTSVQSHPTKAAPPQRPPVLAPQPAPTQSQPAALPMRAASGQPQRQPSDFVDPAILSYGKSPVHTRTTSKPPEPATPIKSMLAKAAESLPNNGSPFVAEAGRNGSQKGSKTHDMVQQALVPGVQQSVAAQTQNGGAEGKQEASQMETGSKKKVRRGQKKKAVSGGQDPPPVMNADVSRNGNDMNGNAKRGQGWRSTPLLRPSPQASSPHDKDSAKKTRRQQYREEEKQQNGWATEEATDIQDMGDFDFEANHKLFDKKQVFDQLRQGDTTADEDRLVSHNKLPHRPGTHGGKNLHPTENVLSPQLGPKHGSNELDSSSDADTELNFANGGGRSSSRHSVSRVSTKKQPSRQNSVPVENKPHPLTASMSSDRGLGLNRSVTSLRNEAGKAVPSITTSPRPDRTHSPQSAISATRMHAPLGFTSHAAEPYLAICPSMAACPVLLPTALETLEAETISRCGLTKDAITENAARCIAEMAMGVSDDSLGGSRRGSRANTFRGSMASSLTLDRGRGPPPVLVILAGNHAAGARAVAAARHLVCRRTKIIVVEAQYESADTQDPQMKTQTAIIKRIMKLDADIKRGPWRKAYNYIKNLSGPPAVIIDALLAGHTYESLLESNAQHAEAAQKETREMIDWANRSRAPVLSIACPSGVSGTDGVATVLEGEPLAIRPDKVLCLGAPMQGVLDAMKGGERWDVGLADVGINVALRRDEAVVFGALWVAELRFVVDEVHGVDGQ